MPRHEVVSPIPGVFYRRPDPGSPPFAEDGATVTEDQSVGLVEVMKSFHQIPAGAAGTLVEFLVDDEAEVDAGQPVAVVETG
ncbi:biotin-dependent enzyme [Pseudonocardia sediminis]|uniref:Biotin carboxyl carrier protein of acetyl-CoA carboxylase n=1 Tax=Pseudonocardia sediminis TaxID=1397368 RepID=A0A4Q7UX37_PSEST|nr:acetyl-CoA carboxylase [Pseudonocardia sediminis]RZT86446.1 biotin-dependent enzyme [Pseudonocardia sediminis]